MNAEISPRVLEIQVHAEHVRGYKLCRAFLLEFFARMAEAEAERTLVFQQLGLPGAYENQVRQGRGRIAVLAELPELLDELLLTGEK
jgi:hypothetical protein